jgi:hypothetical protein
LLERDSLLPEGSDQKHLLCALHIMKVYPKQGPGCAVAGASHGAIDPKTHHKWVWVFMYAIAELLDVVVSTPWFNIIIILLSTHITLSTSDSLREQTRSA